MSVTFSIHAETTAEWKALESEGAPSVNFSNYNAYRVGDMIGLPLDDEGFFLADAQDVLDGIESWVMNATEMTGSDMMRMRDLGAVATAAKRLGRKVSGA